ncbi:MAG TPA: hypothetical protein VK464_21530 [Symbiobacteriaceae bacterium]|jgi:hypothetical protein|nr:hypothetical protein [Symbiobacteriaceae bacterium]
MTRTLIAVALSVAMLASGCTGRPATAEAPTPVVVLLDRSASTGPVADRYLTYFRQVTESLQGGERLLVLPVSGASLTAPPAVDLTFPAYRALTTNAFTHGRSMKKLRQEAADAVAALLEQPPDAASQHTAILDGLMRAQELLNGRPGVICIISDMVEDSDVVRLDGLTEEQVPAVLAAAAGRAPTTLQGARIHVAGLDAAGALPPARVLAIRHFWEQVFAGAGATLEEYGPTFGRLGSGVSQTP